MKPQDHPVISDEMLNAYIDDELDVETRELVFQQLSHNEGYSQQACETQQLQYLLRLAYQDPPKSVKPPPSNHGLRRSLKGLAASLLLVLGGALGWYSHNVFSPQTMQMAAGSDDELIQRVALQAPAHSITDNVILHVNSAEPEKMQVVLDKAETMLKKYRHENKPFSLDIIVNNSGVELLRSSNSASTQRISRLMQEYDNLGLMACANTLRQLRQQGMKVELLPGVRTDRTAIEVIVERLGEGWRYMKV